jgi:hypothetical protein
VEGLGVQASGCLDLRTSPTVFPDFSSILLGYRTPLFSLSVRYLTAHQMLPHIRTFWWKVLALCSGMVRPCLRDRLASMDRIVSSTTNMVNRPASQASILRKIHRQMSLAHFTSLVLCCSTTSEKRMNLSEFHFRDWTPHNSLATCSM